MADANGKSKILCEFSFMGRRLPLTRAAASEPNALLAQLDSALLCSDSTCYDFFVKVVTLK